MDIALVSMMFFQGFLTTNNQGLFVEVNRPAQVAPNTRAAASTLALPTLVGGKCSKCIAEGLETRITATTTGWRCEASHEGSRVYKHTCSAPGCSFKTLAP